MNVSWKFSGCFMKVLMVFQGSFKVVSKNFKGVSSKEVFDEFAFEWISSQLPEQKEGLFFKNNEFLFRDTTLPPLLHLWLSHAFSGYIWLALSSIKYQGASRGRKELALLKMKILVAYLLPDPHKAPKLSQLFGIF